eukprot:CAMPEP_0119381228 /NCGR_PEP_ID=MMETSP1334-20130426/62190_1 /TAXON_ID=127549 /ORGANISM="Calcidiscus leptoporus, Strain RCC1130" /LENGTH=73 /DNA_ID=CAMNT_0007401285 /DNA_START=268 /DNA_END=487 /DNA_ORIENTATION=+
MAIGAVRARLADPIGAKRARQHVLQQLRRQRELRERRMNLVAHDQARDAHQLCSPSAARQLAEKLRRTSEVEK